MSFVDRILAPVDFSPSSCRSASYAGVLAERLGAELTLLHVAEPIELGYSMVGPSEAILSTLTAERLERRRHQLASLHVEGTVTRREMAKGDAADAIVHQAQQEHSGLIVLATRGANPIQRVLGLGSVTLQVLGSADCPVLTGTHFSEPPQIDGGHILCAVDLEQFEPALAWACRASAEFGAKLTVVHALGLGARLTVLDGDWIRMLRQRATDQFTEVLRQHHVQADILVENGSPREVVANAARAIGAALVVIGRSSAHDSLGRLRANSFDIIRRSPCPVVSV